MDITPITLSFITTADTAGAAVTVAAVEKVAVTSAAATVATQADTAASVANAAAHGAAQEKSLEHFVKAVGVFSGLRHEIHLTEAAGRLAGSAMTDLMGPIMLLAIALPFIAQGAETMWDKLGGNPEEIKKKIEDLNKKFAKLDMAKFKEANDNIIAAADHAVEIGKNFDENTKAVENFKESVAKITIGLIDMDEKMQKLMHGPVDPMVKADNDYRKSAMERIEESRKQIAAEDEKNKAIAKGIADLNTKYSAAAKVQLNKEKEIADKIKERLELVEKLAKAEETVKQYSAAYAMHSAGGFQVPDANRPEVPPEADVEHAKDILEFKSDDDDKIKKLKEKIASLKEEVQKGEQESGKLADLETAIITQSKHYEQGLKAVETLKANLANQDLVGQVKDLQTLEDKKEDAEAKQLKEAVDHLRTNDTKTLEVIDDIKDATKTGTVSTDNAKRLQNDVTQINIALSNNLATIVDTTGKTKQVFETAVGVMQDLQNNVNWLIGQMAAVKTAQTAINSRLNSTGTK